MSKINIATIGIKENGDLFNAIAHDLQGNILKSHGRGHTSHIFFKFNGGKAKEVKAFLKDFAEKEVTSAKKQQIDIDAFKNLGEQRFL